MSELRDAYSEPHRGITEYDKTKAVEREYSEEERQANANGLIRECVISRMETQRDPGLYIITIKQYDTMLCVMTFSHNDINVTVPLIADETHTSLASYLNDLPALFGDKITDENWQKVFGEMLKSSKELELMLSQYGEFLLTKEKYEARRQAAYGYVTPEDGTKEGGHKGR